MSTPVLDDPAAGRHTSIQQIAAASLIGSVVEWYDFFLYGTMAALVFNSEFFPTFDPVTGTLAAFTTFAAGFVTRPFGGVLFGHLGDRIGRKPMLVVTMMIMGLSTFAMGLLPTYDAIGVAAPLLLVLLRMFQGIGLGGEWGGAVLLCVEHAPDRKRGWYASWPQLGVPIGLLLSTVAVKSLAPLGDDALVGWAWRSRSWPASSWSPSACSSASGSRSRRRSRTSSRAARARASRCSRCCVGTPRPPCWPWARGSASP
jgi:MHS family shikimate/dehydroshikimate transporter-like MFS transporter